MIIYLSLSCQTCFGICVFADCKPLTVGNEANAETNSV